MVRRLGVTADSILALEFSQKAALEVPERLPLGRQGLLDSTIHSLALRVITSQVITQSKCKLSKDDFVSARAIERPSTGYWPG